MEKLLAKMKVASVTDFGNKNFEANLTAVQGDSKENKTFSIYTPRAECKLHITNPDAIHFFKAEDEVLVTFTKVERGRPFIPSEFVHNNIPQEIYPGLNPENKTLRQNIQGNGIKLREWLTAQNIEWVANDHFTTIIGDYDKFTLGTAWGKYYANNAPRN